MTPSAIQQYTSAAESIPDEAKLGQVAVYQIADADIPLGKARADLQALGLPLDIKHQNIAAVPTRIRPVDAFPKAAKTFERKRIPVAPGVVTTFWKRDANDKALKGRVKKSADGINYQYIVRERLETIEGKRRQLVYDPVVELVYTMGEWNGDEVVGDSLQIIRRNPIEPLSDAEEEWIAAKVAAMPAEFAHRRTHLDSQAVRRIMRAYLWHVDGVEMKGGFYFVPQEHVDTLDKLGKWVNSMPGSSFLKFSLLNLADERQMIRDALEEDTLEKLNEAMGKAEEYLSDPDATITEYRWKQFIAESGELLDKIEGYSDMLNLKIDRASTQAKLFQLQTMELGKRVQPGKA
jgi:hypothetical protein